MVNKREIKEKLERFLSMDGEYRICDDGTIVAYGNVNAGRAISHLPFKFSSIAGHLYLANSNLKSFQNSPAEVGGNLWAHNNQIQSLAGMPSKVGGNLSLERNPLKSLEGLSTEIGGWIELTYDPKLPLLRTLVAKLGLVLRLPSEPTLEIEAARDAVNNIMFRYQGQGKRAMFDCQKELEDAGFGGNARW
jgi:hypothetical protein